MVGHNTIQKNFGATRGAVYSKRRMRMNCSASPCGLEASAHLVTLLELRLVSLFGQKASYAVFH